MTHHLLITVIATDGSQHVVSLRREGDTYRGHRLNDPDAAVEIPAWRTLAGAVRVVLGDEADTADEEMLATT